MDRKPPRALRLPSLSVYVLGQLLGPVAILTLLLTSVIWLVTSLPLLDLVINRGQSAPTFLYLMLLELPSPLTIIMPFAFFFATLFTLQRLAADSELVVMASAGYSLRQLAAPVLGAAAIVMMLTYACLLYLAPMGQRVLNAKLGDIRADMAGALLNEGDFNAATPGLTVFIRQLSNNGDLHGILVHDSRDRLRPVTYIADKGILAQTPTGPRLIMVDGTIESSAQNGKQLQVIQFQSETLNLDQFSGPAQYSSRKRSERFLGELLWPTEQNLTQLTRDQFYAEAHDRISQPLYCLAFALIALAAVVRGRRQRGSVAMRLGAAIVAGVGLRVIGFGIVGLAQRHQALVAAFYLLPLLGTAGAILILAGYTPQALAQRFQARPA
ncbi:MAG TPA: LptF/LptG family permease [Rhizomicrobium sp.]|jgi:lipopolysaccharide export system permease protein|nr:LptF/LptG family permease [Rhizomicrobium sp.]